jgi:hypothetical protein
MNIFAQIKILKRVLCFLIFSQKAEYVWKITLNLLPNTVPRSDYKYDNYKKKRLRFL